MNLLKKSVISFYRACQKMRWYVQFTRSLFAQLVYFKIQKLDHEKLGKILILVPHSDDEWIGCSQVIKKADDVTCAYFHLYGENLKNNNIKKRDEEINLSAATNHFNLLNLRDNHEERLKELLHNNYFDTVFTPSPFDWHNQHRYVFTCLAHSLELSPKSPQVYYYNISVPHYPNEKLFFLPMSKKEQSEKWSIFSYIYISQSFMPSYRYALQERLDTRGCAFSGELYAMKSRQEMLQDLNFISDSKNQEYLNRLNSLINHIFNIRLNIFRTKLWD